ncbi:hypothetical protein QJQ45_019529 [Haematococcus lacustris]|nr:hypothetical protein QJQ45_019529 [Haematococcus lacustris]
MGLLLLALLLLTMRLVGAVSYVLSNAGCSAGTDALPRADVICAAPAAKLLPRGVHEQRCHCPPSVFAGRSGGCSRLQDVNGLHHQRQGLQQEAEECVRLSGKSRDSCRQGHSEGPQSQGPQGVVHSQCEEQWRQEVKANCCSRRQAHFCHSRTSMTSLLVLQDLQCN